jgi:hypothetical protein
MMVQGAVSLPIKSGMYTALVGSPVMLSSAPLSLPFICLVIQLSFSKLLVTEGTEKTHPVPSGRVGLTIHYWRLSLADPPCMANIG